MNTSLLMIGLVAAGFGLAIAPANAFTVTPLPTFGDTQFQGMMSSGDFTELFVAESRIGNNATNGTQELQIFAPGFGIKAQEQTIWTSGQAVDFTLEYTGSEVRYTVGGKLLSTNAFSGSVTDIFFRTRAAANATMTLSNLSFNGAAIGMDLLSSTQGTTATSDVDYLQIRNIQGAFTLSGQSTMSWTGTRPTNSNLAYQIKVGTTPQPESVPEPSLAGVLLLGGLAGLGCTKRKK